MFGATCDVDGSGRLDREDAIAFVMQCRADPFSRWCDLNFDGLITRADVMTFVQRCRNGSHSADSIVDEALRLLDAD